ncbi:Uncharacterized protein DBV15_03148 [Temnothorax longispinosus]|uniref:Uncharacterized protein n=1 Tax=Temnothorax longispinosus TaxID=300112 RepID=A0A4S2KNB8_9HYME|nr:Uncharacterized protein DBV15_03148 [Temnothorax longispinosus]
MSPYTTLRVLPNYLKLPGIVIEKRAIAKGFAIRKYHGLTWIYSWRIYIAKDQSRPDEEKIVRENREVNTCPARRGAASYFANAAATNPSDEVHEFTARREGFSGEERRRSTEEKKTKSTVFPLGRMHRREVHASQPHGLLVGNRSPTRTS